MLDSPSHFSISKDALVRCQALVAEIDAKARATGAYDNEREWVSPSGEPVHARRMHADDVTASFLAELPQRSHFFTGWAPQGATLNALGRAIWRVIRPMSPTLGARIFVRWWHRLQLEPHYDGLPLSMAAALADQRARRLPPRLRPPRNFDGTALDRVALCERLLAMQQLGLLDRLGATGRPVVLEIGAGYGMLAHALLRAFPNLVYLIIDLPSSLALSGCYLASRCPGRVFLAAPNVTLAEGDVGLALNTELSAVAQVRIDLAINTLSFAEMSESVVESYATFLRHALRPHGLLFEQNYDNSHVGRTNFCNPTAVLGRHLKECGRAAGWHLRGIPRIWSTS